MKLITIVTVGQRFSNVHQRPCICVSNTLHKLRTGTDTLQLPDVVAIQTGREISKARGCRTNRSTGNGDSLDWCGVGDRDDHRVAYNFVAADRDQLMLMPPSVADWLPADHLAWFVLDVVAELDLSAFYAVYRPDGALLR